MQRKKPSKMKKPPRHGTARKTARHTTRTCFGKVRYRDKREADSAVHRIGSTSSRGKVPTRAYECWDCHGWHLSSKPDRYGQVEDTG